MVSYTSHQNYFLCISNMLIWGCRYKLLLKNYTAFFAYGLTSLWHCISQPFLFFFHVKYCRSPLYILSEDVRILLVNA